MSRLGARLRRHRRLRPGAQAVYAGERWWSYGELVAAAEPIGKALGVVPGDVVAIVMARGIEMVLAIAATALAGAIPAVIDPADPELAARTLARLRPAIALAGMALPSAATLEMRDSAAVLGPRAAVPWESVARPGIAHIIFTSSSTADPKGVVWSEVRAGFDLAVRPTELQRAAPGGIAVPLCSALGLQDLLRALHYRLATVLLDTPFRAGLDQVRALGVNRLKLTPTQVEVLLASGMELPALRTVMVASAPIAAERLHALAARLPAARIGRSYGLTESGAATVLWIDRHPKRLRSVGRPIAYRRVTVRDREGHVLPPRTWGEVVIEVPVWDRGDGYLDPTPALARRFDNATLRTGDRGIFDARGFLLLGPRHAEILKVGGRSVSAPRIEESLRGLGGITEVTVVGVPDRALGQVPCAVFAPSPGCRPDELATAARADESPRWFLPRLALPRGSTGKVRRGLLAHEAARWTAAFPQLVAPDHRTYPAYAVDPRVSIVDGGIAPWFGDATLVAGRAIALVTRRPVRVLALAYLQAGAADRPDCRLVVGPVPVEQAEGELSDQLLDVFATELLRLVALLPGEPVQTTCVRPARDAFVAAGFTPSSDGWLVRGAGDHVSATGRVADDAFDHVVETIAVWAQRASAGSSR